MESYIREWEINTVKRLIFKRMYMYSMYVYMYFIFIFVYVYMHIHTVQWYACCDVGRNNKRVQISY